VNLVTYRGGECHPPQANLLQLDFIEEWAVIEDELVHDVDDTADLLEHLTSGIDKDNMDKVIHALGQDSDN
jgi:hypothetical protein